MTKPSSWYAALVLAALMGLWAGHALTGEKGNDFYSGCVVGSFYSYVISPYEDAFDVDSMPDKCHELKATYQRMVGKARKP